MTLPAIVPLPSPPRVPGSTASGEDAAGSAEDFAALVAGLVPGLGTGLEKADANAQNGEQPADQDAAMLLAGIPDHASVPAVATPLPGNVPGPVTPVAGPDTSPGQGPAYLRDVISEAAATPRRNVSSAGTAALRDIAFHPDTDAVRHAISSWGAGRGSPIAVEMPPTSAPAQVNVAADVRGAAPLDVLFTGPAPGPRDDPASRAPLAPGALVDAAPLVVNVVGADVRAGERDGARSFGRNGAVGEVLDGPAPSAAAPVFSVPSTTATAPTASAPAAPAPANTAAQLVPEVVAVHRRGVDGTHSLTVDITPEDLGPVRLHVELRDGQVELRLAGATDAAREALRAALPELRRALEAAGVGTGSLAVSPDAPSAGHSDTRQNGAGSGSGPGPGSGDARPSFGGQRDERGHSGREPTPAPRPVSAGRNGGPALDLQL